jgi:DNA helicase II / ATP-dependent DNA helicase PcrA
MTDNFLQELNDSQRVAVTYCDGPSLVIAGAGSGKTRVLTYKIAYLLYNGMRPYHILALTFTNKAAKEMKQRIAKQVGDELASQLWMGTFHSVFSHILRREASSLGFSSNFTIYDASDSRSLLKSIIRESGLDEKVYKPATVASKISIAKNRLLFPDDYARDAQMCEVDFASKMPRLRDIYDTYFNRCKKADVMDFDDLLLYTYLLFERYPEILKKYEDKFRYVLVDEYQDTNYAQHKIVLQLTQHNQLVCVVGDDAQSIYSFRGADIDNILNFNDLYKSAKIFKLEQNYRSTQHIVKAANSLISHNVEQIKKDVYSKNDVGELVSLYRAYSDMEEAVIVCNEILRLKRTEQCDFNDFAILYRTNSQSRTFEESMRKRNIPYKIYGGLSFYQRKEIKDVISYFRIVSNPNDEEAFKRIINYPARGIGDITVNKIISCAQRLGISLWTAISDQNITQIGINNGTINKLVQFRTLIENFISRFAIEDSYTLGVDIIKESGIRNEIFADRTPENLSRQENIQEFVSGIQDFVETRREEGHADEVSLADFLQEVSLLTDLDSNRDVDAPKVTLMTIHSAKGLEFPTVFIVGVEENIFPSPMCLNSARQIEEERRLFYVAITRAEKHCFITYAEHRYRYGNMEFDSPSRFLKDIDPKFIKEMDKDTLYVTKTDSKTSFRRPLFDDSQLRNSSSIDSSAVSSPSLGNFKPLRSSVHRSQPMMAMSSDKSSSKIQEGNIIEHERFGIGSVLRVEGSGENMKATVQFKNTGVKQLLLKFARFKVIQ